MCQSVQDGDHSLKRPGDQYPRDIVKPEGLKNDVNGMRSVERKKLGQGIGSKWGLLLKENTLFSDTHL